MHLSELKAQHVSELIKMGEALEIDEQEDDDYGLAVDSNNLAFLYQETTEGGSASRFHKFVDRDDS